MLLNMPYYNSLRSKLKT